MVASELYRAGRLGEAIAAQVEEVRAQPADGGRRVFLFELLAFAGELDRARRQLDALESGDPDRDLAVRQYRLLLDAEALRRRVFAEGIAPEFLGEPGEHLRLRLEAAGLVRQGRPAEARALLERAADVTPALAGRLNGTPFASLRDADDLLGGVLEVMAEGKYFWVCLEQVVSVAANPPRFPRDLLYFPARLELEAETGEVFLPNVYPGTHARADDLHKLGRASDWVEADGGPVLGVGARVFVVDDEAIPLLEWRELVRDEPIPPEA